MEGAREVGGTIAAAAKAAGSSGGETPAEVPSEEEQDPAREFPPELPVLPLSKTVLFPSLLSPLLAQTEHARRVVDAALASPERLMLASALRRSVEGEPRPEDLFRVGTVLRIVKILKQSDRGDRLLVQGVVRARVEDFVRRGSLLRARLGRFEAVGDSNSVEVAALQRQVAQQLTALIAQHPALPGELQNVVLGIEDPGALADFAAQHLELDVAQKQQVLEEADVAERLRTVLVAVNRAAEALRVETEIRDKVQSEVGKTQREFLLRQQLEAIRVELGEKEDEAEEIERWRQRIEAAAMPEEARERAERELDRLAQTPAASAEQGVQRGYLEWLVELPWSRLSEDRIDIAAAQQILGTAHYDLEKVRDRILEYIAVLSLKRDLKGPILCFVGPPGTGKTSLGRSIANALGREFVRVSLGGLRDEAEIRGHRRTYVGALPGRILQGLRRAGTRNPVFLLDEIDKVGSDAHGDPSSALLEVLDPEQNHTFSDHYLELPFDLSQVLFVATANWMEPVPAALRDRLEVIELPGYTREDKVEIAKRFLIPRQKEQNGLADTSFAIEDEALQQLIAAYTREAGVRGLEREVGSLCRKAARRVVEEGPGAARALSAADLPSLLGPARFESEVAELEGRSGVAVALAWTPVGGEILLVESTRMAGEEELRLTGSLGEVMRESAEAARSWLRSRASSFGIPRAHFAESTIHLHVPAGAVPKDGPSAGVAMVASLASLLTGRRAHPDVAMTGEITLRGTILPVGGVAEKVLAAKRAGIREVVLPERNRRNIEEMAPGTLGGLTLSYASTVGAALQRVLGPEVQKECK